MWFETVIALNLNPWNWIIREFRCDECVLHSHFCVKVAVAILRFFHFKPEAENVDQESIAATGWCDIWFCLGSAFQLQPLLPSTSTVISWFPLFFAFIPDKSNYACNFLIAKNLLKWRHSVMSRICRCRSQITSFWDDADRMRIVFKREVIRGHPGFCVKGFKYCRGILSSNWMINLFNAGLQFLTGMGYFLLMLISAKQNNLVTDPSLRNDANFSDCSSLYGHNIGCRAVNPRVAGPNPDRGVIYSWLTVL